MRLCVCGSVCVCVCVCINLLYTTVFFYLFTPISIISSSVIVCTASKLSHPSASKVSPYILPVESGGEGGVSRIETDKGGSALHEASPPIQFSSILLCFRSDWGPDPCPSLWALFASFGHAHGILSQITIQSHFFEIGHVRRRISDRTGRRPSSPFKSLSFQDVRFRKKVKSQMNSPGCIIRTSSPTPMARGGCAP